jgi:hypothetical protein
MNSEENTLNRPSISDGTTTRPIWRPEDGHGDPDFGLYERTRYTQAGHPTWKVYCGDAPEKVNGVLVAPPHNCYLDDRAAYKILHWGGFSRSDRSRFWRHDFASKGELRPRRKNRGRPALVQGGEVAVVEGTLRKYRFTGADNLKDLDQIIREVAAQKTGRTLDIVDTMDTLQPESHSAALLQSIETSQVALAAHQDPPRPTSPLTANFPNLDSEPLPKRARYTADGPEADSPANLNADINLLKELNQITMEKNVELQKENKELIAELITTKAFWAFTASELIELRLSKQTTSAALHDKADDKGNGDQSLAIALQKKVVAYQELSKYEYAKFKGAGIVQLSPQAIKQDLEEFRITVAIVLGDEWKAFEAEIEEAAADIKQAFK